MLKRIVSGVILTLLTMGMLVMTFNIQQIESNLGTITVPIDYPTIQQAINAANDGDTIAVRANTYYENLIVNKTVSLYGEGMDTIIDGQGVDNTITVVADGVTIEGFAVTNCGSEYPNSGIFLDHVTGSTVQENNILNNLGHGIFVMWGNDNLVLNNRVLLNGETGIRVDVSNAVLVDNVASQNNVDGIKLYDAFDCIIENCNTSLNERSGIAVMAGSRNITVQYNIAERNGLEWNGIFFHGSVKSNIMFNIAKENGYGINLGKNCTENTIVGNNIENNEVGIRSYLSYNNSIFHNNFIDNTQQFVISYGYINIWNELYPSGGNHWSDYTGADDLWGENQNLKGYDMIGDMVYVLDEDNMDNYPLMLPWRQCRPPITEFPDLDGSGKVTIIDIAIVAKHYGEEFEDP